MKLKTEESSASAYTLKRDIHTPSHTDYHFLTPEDYVTYPFLEFWEDALLDIFKPEDGWTCTLPYMIRSELHNKIVHYHHATVPRFKRLYALNRDLNAS